MCASRMRFITNWNKRVGRWGMVVCAWQNQCFDSSDATLRNCRPNQSDRRVSCSGMTGNGIPLDDERFFRIKWTDLTGREWMKDMEWLTTLTQDCKRTLDVHALLGVRSGFVHVSDDCPFRLFVSFVSVLAVAEWVIVLVECPDVRWSDTWRMRWFQKRWVSRGTSTSTWSPSHIVEPIRLSYSVSLRQARKNEPNTS